MAVAGILAYFAVTRCRSGNEINEINEGRVNELELDGICEFGEESECKDDGKECRKV